MLCVCVCAREKGGGVKASGKGKTYLFDLCQELIEGLSRVIEDTQNEWT